MTFSRWPDRILPITAVIWAVSLVAALLTIGTDVNVIVGIAGFSFMIYFSAIVIRLCVGVYRRIIIGQRRREFERTRAPIVGQVVRKYERTYQVGEDRNTVTEHCVVVDPGPEQSAHLFVVDQSVYQSVEEGQSSVRALPRWQSTDKEMFEVMQ